MNYALLSSIVEHVTGRTLWGVLRSDVLRHPVLRGLRYPVRDALAADGWQIVSDPAYLARWGYDLYGGSIVSASSKRAMSEFRGEHYGLGLLDLSDWNPATDDNGLAELAIGHAGLEPGVATMLVAFPDTAEVVSVQAYGGDLARIKTEIEDLLDAVR